MSDDPRVEAMTAVQLGNPEGIYFYDGADESLMLASDAAEAVLSAADAVDPLRNEGTVCVRLDGLADQIARYLVREQSNGLCDDNYPNPCDGCDCFDGSTIRYAQAQAAGIVELLQSLAVQ